MPTLATWTVIRWLGLVAFCHVLPLWGRRLFEAKVHAKPRLKVQRSSSSEGLRMINITPGMHPRPVRNAHGCVTADWVCEIGSMMRQTLQLAGHGQLPILHAASQSSAQDKYTDIVFVLSQATNGLRRCGAIDFSLAERASQSPDTQAYLQMHITQSEPEAVVLWLGGSDEFQGLKLGHLMMELAARCSKKVGKRLQLVESEGTPWIHGSMFEELGFEPVNSTLFAPLEAEPEQVIHRVVRATRKRRRSADDQLSTVVSSLSV